MQLSQHDNWQVIPIIAISPRGPQRAVQQGFMLYLAIRGWQLGMPCHVYAYNGLPNTITVAD